MNIRNWLACLLMLVAAGALYGQGGVEGTILGTVTDVSGGSVSKADVQVTNVDTGVTETTRTTDAGTYSVAFLHPGNYRVTVEAPNFQKVVFDNFNLAVAQHARIDAVLKPGAVTETVNVGTTAVALDTDTAEIANVVSARQVEDLPLNSRNFVALLFLNPGVVQTGGESGGNTASSSPRGAGAISINGGRSSSNQYLIDGMYNNDTIFQVPAISPSIDAIQEFKTQSGAYSAEYGNSANQVNIGFKSGANELHGTVFEFFRNDVLDARSAFQTGITPELRQNQFGFTLGGPIWIPKVYNGRNRSFFFANYEGLRIATRDASTTFVPTQSQLGFGTPTGDALFAPSDLTCGGTAGCALLNPLAGYTPFAQDANGNYIVPAADFSNFGRQFSKHFPAPNLAGNPNGNYTKSLGNPTTSNQQNYRFDQNLGPNNALFFRYSRANYVNTGSGVGLLPEGQANFISKQHSYQGGYTHTFSASLVNQFKIGYLRSDNDNQGIAAPQAELSALNFTGLYPLKSTPYVEVNFPGSNLSGAGGAANNDPTLLGQSTYDISDTVILNHGKHTFSMGADYRRLILNDGGNASYGLISFDGQFSNSPVADMLLGYAQAAQTAVPTPFSTPGVAGTFVTVPHSFFAPFFQDDWKATRRLTVNLGLRYDFQTVPYNESNHYGWFDPTGPGFLIVADKSLITKGLGGGIYKYAGGKTPFPAQKNVFAPRVGFAFRPFENTVIRSGYGVFFDSSEDSETRQFAEFYPYSVRLNLTGSKTQGTPLLTNTLYPALSTPAPVDPSQLGFLLTQVNNKKNPYVQEWNLSIERELAGSTKAEISYVGSKATHLVGRRSVNQPSPYDPANPTTPQSRQPFSNFGSTILVDEWDINSNYNALNGKLEANTHGLNLLAVYTWSKSMDDKSSAAGNDGESAGWQGPLDSTNFKRDYSRSAYDVGQRFVASFLYDIPAGRGRALSLHGPLNYVLGGWQVNGIATFQGGFPFSVNGHDGTGLIGNNYAQRADIIGNPLPSGFRQNSQHWFNTSAFANPGFIDPLDPAHSFVAGGVFGNSGRHILRAPGLNNWDMSLFKNFEFSERFRAQFRAETFNTFNHTQLGAPDAQVTSATFGQIQGVRIPGRILQLGLKLIW